MALVYLAAAWLTGVYWGLVVTAAAGLTALWALAGAGLAAIWWRRPYVRWPLLAVAVAAFGLWRAAAAVVPIGEGHVALLNGHEVTLRGWVADESVVRYGSQRFLLQVEHAVSADGSTAVEGTVAVVVPRFPEVRYGDELELKGRLETPPDFDGFAYRDYLARQGIHSIVRYPRLDLLSTGGGSPFWATLHAVRDRLRASLAGLLPEPQAALATGLLVGDRSKIPNDLVEAFRVTGTSHILAISGWHVAIVVGVLTGLSQQLLRTRGALCFALTAVGVVGYAVLAGMAPSVLRATLMGIMALLALQLGRPRDGLTGLAFACIAMTLYRPQTILDVGFQLSALATLGLIVLGPRFVRWLRRLPAWVAGVLAMTLAAQVAVFPVLVLNFQQVSPVVLVVNLVAVPIVPGGLVWSAIGAVAALIWPPLGAVPAWLAWLHLAALVWVVEAGAGLPYAAVNLEKVHPLFAWAYYGLLLLLVDGGRRTAPVWAVARRLVPSSPPRRVLLGLAVAAALVASALWFRHDGDLHITVLDVGQGDATLLRTPAGHRILVDGGPNGVSIGNALGRRLPYWDKSLDLVILTHAHDDHLVGLLDVVQTHSVGRVLQGPPPQRPSPAYKRWSELLESLAVPVSAAETGQRMDLGGGAQLVVAYAGEAWEGDDDWLNDSSLILRVERGHVSMYLTGDAGPLPQRWLLERGQVRQATILQVPHHGAAGGLDETFLQVVAPRVAVISVGQNNRFGHPSAGTLALLSSADIYRTDLHGSIDILVGQNGYRVERSR